MTSARTVRRAEPAHMHQRFRDRRREVREADRRRGRRQLTAALVAMAVVAALGALAASPLLAVAAVSVEGVEGTRAEQVRSAGAYAVGAPLLAVDLPRLEARVEALPWVASATARRSPPRTVSLRVLPRVPAAVVVLADLDWPVDPTGVVVPGVPDPGLPRIDARHVESARPGAPIDDRGIRAALAALSGLPADVSALVREVEAADADDLRLALELRGGKITVRLGDDENLPAKARALSLLLADLGSGAGGAELDVRAPSNPVVRR